MELRHFTAFLAVADELNFRRAAEKLHIAQPALSQQIQALERDLKVILFERSTRSVSLSDAGAAFYQPAQRVMREVAAARAAAVRGDASGSVSVGFTRASTHDMLPRLTRAVHTREPHLRLNVRGAVQATEGMAALRADELDLAFVRDTPADDQISTRIVRLDRLTALVPHGHPLAAQDEIAIADLREEPFITFPSLRGSAVRGALVSACRGAGFEPRIEHEFADPNTICGLVAAGMGVALMISAPSLEPASVVSRPLRDAPAPIPLLLAWRTDNTSSAVGRVLEIAEDVLPAPSAG